MDENTFIKLQEIEDSLQKYLGDKVFVSIIHINSYKDLLAVWRKAVPFVSLQITNSNNFKVIQDLINSYGQILNKTSISKSYRITGYIKKLYAETYDRYPTATSFLTFLAQHQILRFEMAKKEFVSYCLSSTTERDVQSFEELEEEEPAPPDFSLVIEGKNMLISDQNGNFDLKATLAAEKKTSNIASTLSAMSLVPRIKIAIEAEIPNGSANPVVYKLYKNATSNALFEGLYYVALLASKFAYNQIRRGITTTETQENTVDYISKLPQIDPQLKIINGKDSLWTKVYEQLLDEDMDDEDKEIIFSEILNEINMACRFGIIVPDSYFDLSFRRSTEREQEIEGSDYSLDTRLLGDDGEKLDPIQETYTVTYSPESFFKMFHFATRGIINTDFYKKIPERRFEDKLDDFLLNPMNFLTQENYSKAFSNKQVHEILLSSVGNV